MDGFNQSGAWPEDQQNNEPPSSEINQNEDAIMDCNTDCEDDADDIQLVESILAAEKAQGDGSFDENDEEEYPIETLSPCSSSFGPYELDISGDEEDIEEGIVDEIINGIDNLDVDQNGLSHDGYEVHYIGLYKFVYFLPKTTSEEQAENGTEESVTNDDIQPTR